MAIVTEVHGSSCHLHASGEVDMANADELSRVGVDHARDPKCEHLVVDLTGVTFIDSSGLNALLSIYNAATDAGTGIRISASARVTEVLRLGGLATMLAEPDAPQ